MSFAVTNQRTFRDNTALQQENANEHFIVSSTALSTTPVLIREAQPNASMQSLSTLIQLTDSNVGASFNSSCNLLIYGSYLYAVPSSNIPGANLTQVSNGNVTITFISSGSAVIAFTTDVNGNVYVAQTSNPLSHNYSVAMNVVAHPGVFAVL